MQLRCLVLCSILYFVQGQNVVSVSCEYIENVIRGQKDTRGILKSAITTGCVRGEGDNGYISNELALSNSTIPILRRKSIKNMPWLVAVYCIYCHIDVIESGAFHNVGNITEFEFSYGVLTEVRRGIFNVLPKLEVLDLRGNKIYNIDDQAFAGMPVLRHLNLNGNEMEYWKREWFTNTTSIVTVKFVKNKLRSVPPLAFAGFKILQRVYFDDNEITIIHRDAFKGVTFMFDLGLSNNRLTTLSPNIFPNHLTIENFDISGNLLNFLPTQTMKQITVQEMYLLGNPWKCQCLNLINFWLEFINGTSKSNSQQPECTGPDIPVCVSSIASACLEYVEKTLTDRYLSLEVVQKMKTNRKCTQGYYALFYGDNI